MLLEVVMEQLAGIIRKLHSENDMSNFYGWLYCSIWV